jgi:hypothetical protein
MPFSCAASSASAVCLSLEARQSIRVAGKRQWQNLDRHIANKPDITGAVDFAHPDNTELGANLVRAEAGAWSEGQVEVEG